MKKLLLLLFTTTCLAQNAKVTAYRAFSESTKEPCSVKDLLKSPEYGMVFTAKSNDPNLIKSLQKIKSNCLKWKKKKFNCNTEFSLVIYNMFVIETGNNTDTIFTTKNNYSIVVPEQKIQFIDKKQELNKSLTGDIKDFFKRDFLQDFMPFEARTLDSIQADQVLYEGNPYKELINDSIQSLSATFSYAPDDSIKNLNGMKYLFSTYTVTLKDEFMEDNRTDKLLFLSVDKIKLGDSEDLLISKYPNSTKSQYPYGTSYQDMKNNYGYGLKIKDNKGLIVFEIKDKKVNSISVYIP